MSMEYCPCGTGNKFLACCGRFISGDQHAATPEELMRSRYTAYTLVDTDYIFETMLSPAADFFSADNMRESAQTTLWAGLDVLKASQLQNKGIVEFIAHYYRDDIKNKLHEISEFSLENGKWFYVNGTTPKQKISRNDICPCGSEKKYKKCCGK
jgi:SEC-C motif-containing protein